MEAATAADFWLRFLAIASLGSDKIASRMRGDFLSVKCCKFSSILPLEIDASKGFAHTQLFFSGDMSQRDNGRI